MDLAVKRRLKCVWVSICVFYAKLSANSLRASAPTPLVDPTTLQTLATPLIPRGEKTVPAMRTARWRFSLASRPMTVVFGLGTRLHVNMCTNLENGVLSNGQQPQSVVNGFC